MFARRRKGCSEVWRTISDDGRPRRRRAPGPAGVYRHCRRVFPHLDRQPVLHARYARDLFRLGEGPQAPVFLRQHAAGRGQLRLLRQPEGDPQRADHRRRYLRDLRACGRALPAVALCVLDRGCARVSVAGGSRARLQFAQLGLPRPALQLRGDHEAGGPRLHRHARGGRPDRRPPLPVVHGEAAGFRRVAARVRQQPLRVRASGPRLLRELHPHPALPPRELLDDRRGKPGAPHESVARAGRREQPGAGRLLQRGCGCMSVIEAGYFDGKSSLKRPVGIVVSRGRMKIIGRDLEQEFDARLVRRSLRIANTPRWLYLPGGGACVTSDNAAVDRITRERRYERVLHKWESRPAYAALAVALVAGMLWLLVDRGVPVAVERIAEHIPVEAEAALGHETLRALDERMMRKSALPGSRQDSLRAKFADMDRAAGETTPYSLEFRQSFIGANAFGLPSGIIVVTDDLVRVSRSDGEVLGVLAHELGHVKHRHTMRRLLEGSATALIIAGGTGDA